MDHSLSFDQPRDADLGETRPMERQDYLNVFEIVKDHAVGSLANEGEMPPTLFMPSISEGDVVRMGVMNVAPLLSGGPGKDILAGVIEKMLSHANHDFCVFAHEAWMIRAEARPGETPEQARERLGVIGSLADRPDREEVLMILIRAKDGQAMATLPIIRDASGAIAEVAAGDGLIFPDENAQFSGGFVNNDQVGAPAQNAPSTTTLQ